MKIKFRKVYNHHKRIRSEQVDGVTKMWPRIGYMFRMIAPPLAAGDLRYIQTSRVTRMLIDRPAFVLFETENGSFYSVEEKS